MKWNGNEVEIRLGYARYISVAADTKAPFPSIRHRKRFEYRDIHSYLQSTIDNWQVIPCADLQAISYRFLTCHGKPAVHVPLPYPFRLLIWIRRTLRPVPPIAPIASSWSTRSSTARPSRKSCRPRGTITSALSMSSSGTSRSWPSRWSLNIKKMYYISLMWVRIIHISIFPNFQMLVRASNCLEIL